MNFLGHRFERDSVLDDRKTGDRGKVVVWKWGVRQVGLNVMYLVPEGHPATERVEIAAEDVLIAQSMESVKNLGVIATHVQQG